MPAFFLELFSEEIPARMQVRAAEELVRLLRETLSALSPADVRHFSGPRRIAVSAHLDGAVAASQSIERGPRIGAPEQALAGFLRKHGAARTALREEGGFHVLEKSAASVPAAQLISQIMPDLLRRFAWPKIPCAGAAPAPSPGCGRCAASSACSMAASSNSPSRPAATMGIAWSSSDVTEGHRFMSPGAVHVRNADDWERSLEQRHVVASAEERRARVSAGITDLAARQDLTVVEDPGLIDEVCGPRRMAGAPHGPHR